MKKLFILLLSALPVFAMAQNSDYVTVDVPKFDNLYELPKDTTERLISLKDTTYRTQSKIDPPIYLSSKDLNISFVELKSIKSIPIKFRGQNLILQCDTVKENFDSKDEYGTLYLVDQLGKYFEECKKDSFVYGTTIRIISDTLPDNPSGNIIIRGGELVDLYKSKEPDLVGFYEWLKSKK